MSVIIIVTNNEQFGNLEKKTGYWLSEVSHPYEVFTKNGLKVHFVSPKGGKAPIDPGSVDAAKKSNDEISIGFLNNKDIQHQLEHTLSSSEVLPNVSQYSAIFFAGGHGPLWDVAVDETTMKLTAKIYETNKVVAAVCHGPAGLLNIKLSGGDYLLKGKTVTGFSNTEEEIAGFTKDVPFSLEDKLKERAKEFKRADNWANFVVEDDRVITGQNPASAHDTAEAVVRRIKKN